MGKETLIELEKRKGLKLQQGLFKEAESINVAMKCHNTANEHHLASSVHEFNVWLLDTFEFLTPAPGFQPLQSFLHSVLSLPPSHPLILLCAPSGVTPLFLPGLFTHQVHILTYKANLRQQVRPHQQQHQRTVWEGRGLFSGPGSNAESLITFQGCVITCDSPSVSVFP